ncbi:MAG TPA: polyphosphate kinase 1 [Planctomycetaceae bacterium]|nr:polyphosphate kinase 1 [Planctomycetaceae bacterium]
MKLTPRYINRELSWLNFNERVLQEANDPSVPLVERLVFLGIFSNNLDEFYRVRYAFISRLAKMEKEVRDLEEIDFDPVALMKAIQKKVGRLNREFNHIFENIRDKLAVQGIRFLDETKLNREQGDFVLHYFRKTVRQHLFPIMLDRFKNFSNLRDNQIYLLVDLKHKSNPLIENHALIEIPSELPRFLVLPMGADGVHYVLYLDDVIRYCLADVFSMFGYNEFRAYTIKFTRDAELDIDNDISKSFLEVISEGIKARKHGATVRFIYDDRMPKRVLEKIMPKFGLNKRDTREPGGKYHNAKDLMNFPKLGPAALYYEPRPSLDVKRIAEDEIFLDTIRQKDICLHYPYQTFRYIIDLLREASIDPAVRTIKMTIYRTAKDSKVINALINAARNGKEVIVYVELQARFDEELNIRWAARMQEEGIKIIQSTPGLKVHAKLILIRRKENNENVYYGAIGTGNPNESTARTYADEHLLTADRKITSDMNKVFHMLDDRKFFQPEFESLIVSPFSTRSFFMKRIDREIRNAKKGKPAWILIKVNNLVDRRIVDKLYEASVAGVKIDMIVRGICTLIPGVAGMSENIRAVRIVDRFLEHSRIIVFCSGEKPEYYIGSADWMERNFDHRIEVTTPVTDPEIQKDLWRMLQIQIADNVKARLICDEKPNMPMSLKKGAKPVRSQVEYYRYLKDRETP